MGKILLLALAFLLPGCGKFLDKFSRLEEGYTRVYLDGTHSLTSSMSGGMMIYFARGSASGEGGKAFGFTTAELAMTRSVVVPNGSYRVYALGADSGGVLQGQAKCGYGNGGAMVNLTGGTTTINLAISAGNCSFGAESAFAYANLSVPGNTNLDTATFIFCQGTALPCTASSASTYRLKFRLAGGEKFAGNGFSRSEADSITSGCSSAITSGSIVTTNLAFFGSSIFSPPVELLIYNDSTCSGAVVGNLMFPDGLNNYRNVSSGSSVYVDSPVSSSTTYLKFQFPL